MIKRITDVLNADIANPLPSKLFLLIKTKLIIEVTKVIKIKNGIKRINKSPNKPVKTIKIKTKLKRDVTKENMANLLFIKTSRDNSF